MDSARHVLEPAATRVRDPLSNRSMWLAGMITDGRVTDGVLRFNVEFTQEHSRDDRARMVEALLLNVKERWTGEIEPTVMVDGVRRGLTPPGKPAEAKPTPAAKPAEPVRGMSGPGMQAHGGPVQLQPIPGVRYVIAVASGKGGVGKSTISTNLAVSLRRQGYEVGLLDADIYGPSLPLMMNLHGKPMAGADEKVQPLIAYGVKCMSIGFFVDEREPIIWRGPMVMGAVRQLFQDIGWAPLDYLIVDLPPGTGDAQLTMIQNVPLAGAIIVTTPQDLALLDANRGLEMFRKLGVEILGIVENMSFMDVGGQRVFPFGEGGGARMAQEYGVRLLAQVPLMPALREGGDAGRPAALDAGVVGGTFSQIADLVTLALPV